MILDVINNGSAYNKFVELVTAQGGDISYVETLDKFEKARYIIPVTSEEEGYVHELDGGKIGEISLYIGAGRVKKEDSIDHATRNCTKQKSWR